MVNDFFLFSILFYFFQTSFIQKRFKNYHSVIPRDKHLCKFISMFVIAFYSM